MMYAQTPISLIFTLFGFSSLLFAEVDPLTGGFRLESVDLETHVPGVQYSLKRTYNSHSGFLGQFGRGWCSDLDQKIIHPSPEKFGLAVCDKILPLLKVDEKNFSSRGDSGFKLQNLGETLVLKDPQGQISTFDRYGRLQSLGADHLIQFQFGKLYQIQQIVFSGTAFALDFKTNANSQILKISSGETDLVTYQYQGEFLADFSSSQGQKVHYDYAKNGDLIAVAYPTVGPTAVAQIQYLSAGHRVAQITDLMKCVEKFEFQGKGADSYSVSRKCPGDKAGTTAQLPIKPETSPSREASVNGKSYRYSTDEKQRVKSVLVELSNDQGQGPNVQRFEYNYDESQKKILVKTNSGQFTLTVNSKHQISEAVLPRQDRLFFAYQDNGSLRSIKSDRGDAVLFEFDKSGELLRFGSRLPASQRLELLDLYRRVENIIEPLQLGASL